MEDSRFLKRGCAKKVVPWHCQKKLMASLSNLTLNHSFSAALYKRKIKSLLRNNRWLALALENSRCELADKENIVVENEKNLDIIKFSKIKLNHLAENMKKATACLDETLALLALQVLNSPPKGIQSTVNPRKNFQNKLKNLDIDPIEEEAECLENMDTDSVVEKNEKSTLPRKHTAGAKKKNNSNSSKNPTNVKSKTQNLPSTTVSKKKLLKNQKNTSKVSPAASPDSIVSASDNLGNLNEHPVTSTFRKESRKKTSKTKQIFPKGTTGGGALKNGLHDDPISSHFLQSVANINNEIILQDVIDDISNVVVVKETLSVPNRTTKNGKGVCTKVKDELQEISTKKKKKSVVPSELRSVAELDESDRSSATKFNSEPNQTTGKNWKNCSPKVKDVPQEVTAKRQKNYVVPYELGSLDEPEDSSKNITNNGYDVNSSHDSLNTDVPALDLNGAKDFNICYSHNVENCISEEMQYETVLKSQTEQTNKTVRFQCTNSYSITSSQWSGVSEQTEGPSRNSLTKTEVSRTVQGSIDDITVLKDSVSSTNVRLSSTNPFKRKSIMKVRFEDKSIESEHERKKVNKQLKIRTSRKRPLKEHKTENTPPISSNHVPPKKRAVCSINEMVRCGGQDDTLNTFLVTAEVHQPPEGYAAAKKMDRKLVNRCQNMQPSVVLTDIFKANKAVIESIFNISGSQCSKVTPNQLTESEPYLQSTRFPITAGESTANLHNTENEALLEKDFEEQKSENRRRSKIVSYKEPSLNLKMRRCF